jgi:hypothetical protein
MKRFVIVIAAVVIFLLNPPLALSADEKDIAITSASIDLAVPDSPAFAVLGLNPNNVDRPGSPREFATSLVQGVDANGNLQTGVAIEISPYMLLKGKETTLSDYQSKKSVRFLSRTMFTFATAKGATGDDKAARVATGLKVTPWDRGDPRMDEDLVKCMVDAVSIPLSQEEKLRELSRKRSDLDVNISEANEKEKKKLITVKESLDHQYYDLRNESEAELNKKVKSTIEACRKSTEFRSNLWNKSSWSIGAAPVFLSSTGKAEELGYSGVGLWTSVALRIGKRGQAIFNVRYRDNEEIPDEDNAGKFIEQDSFLAGGRIRYGSPVFNINAEGMYIIENKESDQEDDDMFRYGLGAEYNAAKDVWLVFSIGTESGNNEGNEIYVLGNMRFAWSPNPTYKIE